MATLLSVLLGISLSAASGFRIFVPFLVLSIAAKAGFVELADTFAWVGSTPALILLLVATVIEIASYYIPFVDNLLDTIAMPLATIAGTLLMASVVTDMSPMLKWSLAVIAGGGLSMTIHSGTTLTRGASSLTTGGLGNNLVSSGENFSSILISVVAIISPIIAIVIILILIFMIIKFIRRKRKNKKSNISDIE